MDIDFIVKNIPLYIKAMNLTLTLAFGVLYYPYL